MKYLKMIMLISLLLTPTFQAAAQNELGWPAHLAEIRRLHEKNSSLRSNYPGNRYWAPGLREELQQNDLRIARLQEVMTLGEKNLPLDVIESHIVQSTSDLRSLSYGYRSTELHPFQAYYRHANTRLLQEKLANLQIIGDRAYAQGARKGMSTNGATGITPAN